MWFFRYTDSNTLQPTAVMTNKNSSVDEIANVNFFYDDIAHVLPKKRTYFV